MARQNAVIHSESRTVEAELLAAVQQSVIVTDLDWTITYWNRFAETLYGWSSIEALGRNLGDLIKNLSVDQLKIDQSFVQAKATTDASLRAIVRAVIALGDAFHLRVVADGLEDRATWDVLSNVLAADTRRRP